MKYKLSWHAKQRMEQRGISEDDIALCLASPSTQYPGADDKTCILRNVEGRTLKLVVCPEWPDAPFVVVSVMWMGE